MMGFHAIPSLSCLHLHIISKDMQSPALKNKKHFLSFTSRFFISIDSIKKMWNENDGMIKVCFSCW
jgi:aprataxin